MSKVIKHNSAGSRISAAFGAIIVGILLIIFCSIGLIWNEVRNVKMIRALDEVSEIVIDISSDSILPENEGKLVALSGAVTFDQSAKDLIYGIDSNSYSLIRYVEMYQWHESKDGSSTDSEVTYSYTKMWSTTYQDSSNFQSSSHSNPMWPQGIEFETEYYFAKQVNLGAFTLDSVQVRQLDTATLAVPANTPVQDGFKIESGLITNSANYSNPQVGDIRITFESGTSTHASAIAMQQGSKLVDYITTNKTEINRVYNGTLNGAQIVEKMFTENTRLTWILRLVFTILVCGGFAMLFTPLQVFASFIPLIGGLFSRLSRGIAGLIGGVAGLSLSLFIIALTWIAVRPLVAIPLLFLVTALIILVVILSKKKAAERA